MSLGLVIKSPEGLVLAAESRVTLEVHNNDTKNSIFNNFDNATKLFSLNAPHNHIGIVTYGLAAIGQRTAHSFVPELEGTLDGKLDSVYDYAKKISAFYMSQWKQVMPTDYKGPDMTFIVGGFNEGEAHGRVYLINVPRNPEPIENNAGLNNFGITWGGQRDVVDKLLMGYDHKILNTIFEVLKPNKEQVDLVQDLLKKRHQAQIPLEAMAIQDCVNLARLFISTTIDTQELTIGLRGCGGPIDIAVIQRNKELCFIQRKDVK